MSTAYIIDVIEKDEFYAASKKSDVANFEVYINYCQVDGLFVTRLTEDAASCQSGMHITPMDVMALEKYGRYIYVMYKKTGILLKVNFEVVLKNV